MQLTAIADRNTDGQLSEPEFSGWLDLQEQIAKGQVLLTLIDRGHGLFESLDADHDGSLSTRELRNAWGQLKTAGSVTNNLFDQSKLPRYFLGTVSHGHPLMPLGKPTRHAPNWFQAMDRNGDGDLSRREFTGSADVFNRLDHNQDGLIDGIEAAKAQIKK